MRGAEASIWTAVSGLARLSGVGDRAIVGDPGQEKRGGHKRCGRGLGVGRHSQTSRREQQCVLVSVGHKGGEGKGAGQCSPVLSAIIKGCAAHSGAAGTRTDRSGGH